MIFSGFFVNCCLVSAANDNAEYQKTVNWREKIDQKIYEEVDSRGTVPVVVWYQDIDQQIVEQKVERATGLNIDKLQSYAETFDQEMVNQYYEMLTEPENFTEKQSKDIAKDMTAYLATSRQERKREQAQTQAYILERRKISSSMYMNTAKEIENAYPDVKDKLLFSSKYAPMFITELTQSEIEKLAQDDRILEINYDEELEVELPEDWLKTIKDTSEITRIHENIGLSGLGVKVGILEPSSVIVGGDLPEDRFHIIEPFFNNSSHVQNTANILAGNYGMAPSAEVYSVSVEGCANEIKQQSDTKLYAHCVAVEKLIDAGVMVINSSYGFRNSESNVYTDLEKWVDHVVAIHSVSYVQSAGNNALSEDSYGHRILGPGLADNVITVGAYDNKNTNDTSDDQIMYYSSYFHPSTSCFKPDLIAPANMGGGGTSSSAPYVAGVIAMMLELRPSLAAYPQAIKAILMASCQYKTLPYPLNGVQEQMENGLTERQGAGAINPYLAVCIVGQKNYGVRNMEANESSQTIQFMQPCYRGTGINVSISWLRENYVSGNHNYLTSVGANRQNLDLKVKCGNTEKKSCLKNSSAEMVYYSNINNSNKEYILQIENLSKAGNVRYGYAWSIDKNTYQLNKQYEGIYFLKNENSGKYMSVIGSDSNLKQQGYTFAKENMWVFQKKIENDTNYDIINGGDGKLCLFNSNMIDSTHYASMLVDGGSSNVNIEESENGLYILKKIIAGKQYVLSINNNSVDSEADIVWSYANNSNLRSQNWILEKCSYMRGDVDCNGSVESQDALLILQAVVKNVTFTGMQQFLADLNGDGEVSSEDAVIVLNMVTGNN